MLQNGLVGFFSRQIEIVVGPPPPRPRRPTTTTVSLPYSSVIAINNDASHPYDIRSMSCKTRRRRWDFGSRLDRMTPGGFKGEDFLEGSDGNDDDEEEVWNWKGWRRRRRRRWWRDGWKWRRRRRYSEKGNFLDALWIYKVLRPYGWSLPLILLSWLAASGPKAFFISLALSFALSAAALFVRFLWPGAEFDSLGGDSKRKRTSVGRVSRSGMDRGRNDEKRSGWKSASAYDSWLESDLVAQELGLDDPSFGGWADLEEERFLDESGQAIGKQRKGKIESGERSRKSLQEAEAEVPLLLRLLVAMFPFMASWTKLFW